MAISFGNGPAFNKPRKKGAGLNFTAAPDPLAQVEYTGDLEADSGAELGALETAYRERATQERKRFSDTTDSEYWLAVCFRSRDDKERFLDEVKATALGDKYVDGHKLAKLLGIEL